MMQFIVALSILVLVYWLDGEPRNQGCKTKRDLL